MQELYKVLDSENSQCLLCSHFCKISKNHTGKCGVRKNIDGKIESLTKDIIAANGIDPIEKKPLFHVLPSSLSYSIAAPGCNFSCLFCQNASLAQTPSLTGEIHGQQIDPQLIIDQALINKCSSISYTYSEPTVFLELMEKTAGFAKKENLINIMVSNGFISNFGFHRIKDLIHAANIDLKSFNNDFYRKICGGALKPVLNNLVNFKENNIFLEITTLLIPGLNDSVEELENIASFIANELGKDTPWHISRFHPTFKMMNINQTPVSSIYNAIEAGEKFGLEYIYPGNLFGDKRESTACPDCKNIIIERKGYSIVENLIFDGKCPFCNKSINGIFQ